MVAVEFDFEEAGYALVSDEGPQMLSRKLNHLIVSGTNYYHPGCALIVFKIVVCAQGQMES